ncbi:probable H/ACA ribonucleoprotein complex subunit 1 [Galendromus occidentalis]|uniref:H/ACA ribonucleoprotein complex subunit n=1 Tax=Galendromus occidentalis TaxID=34638 RepID=A0AAJ6VYP1_9ACAR|nr:probable H/ACA ribonucleoprotein complex subunit 1 [Galendromus occidentalis]
MSFRGGRGGGRGGFGGRGGGGFGGRGGGGRGGGFGGRPSFQDAGPPEEVVPLGYFHNSAQKDIVVKVTMEDKVPYFNAPVYLQNKEKIGIVDEILGNVRDYWVSVKLNDDVKSNSFNDKENFFIDPAKLLPLERFLPGAPQQRGGGRGGRGGRGGGGRGGFGGGRGGGFGGRGGGGFGGRGGGGFGGRGGGGFGGRGGGGGFGGGRGGGGRGGFGGRGGGGRGRGGY